MRSLTSTADSNFSCRASDSRKLSTPLSQSQSRLPTSELTSRSEPLPTYLRRCNHGRRHAAWSQAKILYLCLQFGTPQTHTTGSGHGSSRLVYLTLYFHAISASSGLQVVAANLEFRSA